MRGYTPGGRFDSDFELDSISDGITSDLTNPAGTVADWWIFNPSVSTKDPLYDVDAVGVGRVWKSPVKVPVIRATITQGQVLQSERGFYNTDTLHLTMNVDDLEQMNPGIIASVESATTRDRVVWKGQVYRPFKVQNAGIVSERYTIVTIDMQQIMPDEMVNDAQFLSYAQA